ncbi:MAG: hypothetical protein Q7R80_04480 [bacterium]|nr:hypothetical protein [bacterium]
MPEEVYGTKFPERVLTAIVQRLGVSWVLPPAPKLPEDCGAIDVTSALAAVVRTAKANGGDAFDCPFDFDDVPRAFTSAEVADVLLDIAMRSHRVVGDDHASEPYDTLRMRPCLRPYIVRAFLEFCHRCGAGIKQVLAFADAAGVRLGGASQMDGLHVGSAAQPQMLGEFISSHRFDPPMAVAVFAYLQDRIAQVGRPLSDEEFRAALGDFVLHANVAHSGPTPSA